MKWLRLTVFFCLFAAPAWAQVGHDPSVVVGLADELNKRATRSEISQCSISSSVYDGNLPSGMPEDCLEIERRTIKDSGYNDLPISVIDIDDLGKLTSLYPPYLRNMDADVCIQRAHTIGDTLAKAGLETVKLYLEPSSFLFIFKNRMYPDERTKSNGNLHKQGWDRHMVNMIYVREKNGNIAEYIIDPFMESTPVPRAQWAARLSNVGSTEVTSRFSFGTGDRYLNSKEYDLRYLQCAYMVMSGDSSACGR